VRITTGRITTRNARFQQWQALSTNRSKRQRAGEFLVQGVRPITLAVEHGWPLRAVLYRDRTALSDWARDLLDTVDTPRYAVAGDLLDELGDRADPGTEMIVVAGLPADDLARIPVGDEFPRRLDLRSAQNPTWPFLGVVFDRPASPGNIGAIVRSADAFGAHGVVVTGHAADPYDPKAVRASTGSLFAVPVVRVASHREVLAWAPGAVVGADEAGDVDVAEHDLTGPTLLVIGSETAGLSAGWRAACDRLVRIPIGGAASSLNAATATGILLYEAARQRAAFGRS
jgi:TrmH family RNA methyltransferase